MAKVECTRELFFHKGMTIRAIAEKTGFDRKTIRKYLQKDDWNQELQVPVRKASKLDPYKPTIDQWLETDRRVRKKQRHTAKRVYERLVEEYGRQGFACLYRTVASYVAQKKRQLYGRNECFLPLEYRAGEGQVDFGTAEFVENGTRYVGSFLNLSFPHSNGGFQQVFEGENAECLQEGLKSIFEHLGGVPVRLWFDNASSMVTWVLKDGGRVLTDSFIRFNEHYGFEAAFCHRGAGHEKGNVENKVGYHRRNMLVPVPEFGDLKAFNRELLSRCDRDQDRDRAHYRTETPIRELFEYVIIINRAPQAIAVFLSLITSNPTALIFIILAFLFVAGMFMESTVNTLLLTPIFLPIVKSVGVDPVHFGILMMTAVTMGSMTPPVGVVLHTVCSLLECPTDEYVKESAPFVAAVLVLLVALTIFPQLVLFLPNLVFGK